MAKHTVWFERPLIPELADHVLSLVEPVFPGDEPYGRLDEAVGAVVGVRVFDAEVMDSAPRLVVIARSGIGTDAVDLAAATARGIAVCNAPAGPTRSTAEHAVALMLAAAKAIPLGAARLRAGEPELYARHRAMQLEGKTLGLIGCGRIARQVAAMGTGLGMSVIAFDPYVDEAPEQVTLVTDLADLLAVADVVSVHVPLSSETHHLCDASFFSGMQPGAVFVNSARGGLVDQEALLDAVERGHLLGAGLDVTDPEPLPADHPLLHHPAIVVTPHIATATPEGRRGNFMGAFEGVVDVLAGRRPQHLVNPEVWEHRVRGATA